MSPTASQGLSDEHIKSLINSMHNISQSTPMVDVGQVNDDGNTTVLDRHQNTRLMLKSLGDSLRHRWLVVSVS